jgi:trans-aconitate methyltransferase
LRVLDAGCGPEAQFSSMLAIKYPTCQFVAWDLHLDQPWQMNKPANLEVVEGDLAALDETDVFDVIYSIDVLEHIEDSDAILDRLVRCLRKGGRLFIHVPSGEERTWFRTTETAAINDFRKPRHGDDHVHQGWSVDDLKEALMKRSLVIIESRRTFGALSACTKELYSLGEAKRIKGIGILLLPFALVGFLFEALIPLRHGNGSMIVAEK